MVRIIATKLNHIKLTICWIAIKLLIITISPIDIYCAQNNFVTNLNSDTFTTIINKLITDVNVCKKKDAYFISLDTLEQYTFKTLCYLRTICNTSRSVINNFLTNLVVACDNTLFPFNQTLPQRQPTLPNIQLVAKDYYTILLDFDIKPSQCSLAPLDEINKKDIGYYNFTSEDYFGMYIKYTISFYNLDGTELSFEKNKTYLGPASNRLVYLKLIQNLMEAADQKVLFSTFKKFLKKNGLNFRIDQAPLLFLLFLYEQSSNKTHFDIPYYQYYFPIEPFINKKKTITIQIEDPVALFSKTYFQEAFKIHLIEIKDPIKLFSRTYFQEAFKRHTIETENQITPASKTDFEELGKINNNKNDIKKFFISLGNIAHKCCYNTFVFSIASGFITGFIGFSAIIFCALIFKLYSFCLSKKTVF